MIAVLVRLGSPNVSPEVVYYGTAVSEAHKMYTKYYSIHKEHTKLLFSDETIMNAYTTYERCYDFNSH